MSVARNATRFPCSLFATNLPPSCFVDPYRSGGRDGPPSRWPEVRISPGALAHRLFRNTYDRPYMSRTEPPRPRRLTDAENGLPRLPKLGPDLERPAQKPWPRDLRR